MLSMNIVRHKTLNTLKSKHDERNDQALLKRLKNLSVIGAKKTLPPLKASEIKGDDQADLPVRRLTMDKLSRMIHHHQSDPLTWSPYVLGRIFNIPEDYCSKLAIYVRPMIHWNKNVGEGNVRLLKTEFVVDVARLKSDDNYLVTYKKIVFPERNEELSKRALADIAAD
jgi:hypothetical protein